MSNVEHPAATWQRGYTTSFVTERRARMGAKPVLYTAYRHRETGAVEYQHGTQWRYASAPLAARFRAL